MQIDWLAIIEPLLTVLVGAAITYVSTLIKYKINEIQDEKLQKHLHLLNELITNMVAETNQQVVDELKRKDEFNEETAGEVFEFTKHKVKQNLTRDSKKVLQYVYTNLDAYIESQIEEEVRKQGALNE